jgi:hypothetical protein
MTKYCVDCGSPIPDNQGSSTCSMCYGDVDHGKDGYYRQWMEEQWAEEQKKRYEEEHYCDDCDPVSNPKCNLCIGS